MQYIIIELPINDKGNYGVADFNKEAFQSDNNVILKGDPKIVSGSKGKIILAYEAGSVKSSKLEAYDY